MKNIAVLGSTGSIGTSTLDVIRKFPGSFRVIALTANSDIDSLYKQIKEFKPSSVCVRDENKARRLAKKVSTATKVYCGDPGLEELVKDKRIDQVMFAVSGAAALRPLISAIKSGKDIALANKEALVMAGQIIMRLAVKHKVNILPVDSEQSAIWQALSGQDKKNIRTIYLTASGGPFRNLAKSKLNSVSINKVLQHPRWKMGKKITVDSATLMNKGLEVLEAMFLFDVGINKIKVLIHPQALIHSMVEFSDAVVMAQLSATDMRIPIQYALAYPQRLANQLPRIDFYSLKQLHFAKPDFNKFPCLGLAYAAAKQLGCAPAVLNAANEVGVEKFLKGEIKFMSIPKVIEKVIGKHRNLDNPCLKDIMLADLWAREEAYNVVRRLN
jgi:1-deoxy-D-xylulose-5-phosphate reductoisomerase